MVRLLKVQLELATTMSASNRTVTQPRTKARKSDYFSGGCGLGMMLNVTVFSRHSDSSKMHMYA